MEFDPELAHIAFAAVLRAQDAQSVDELNEIIGEALRQIGYAHFVAVEFYGPADDRQVRVVDGMNDPAWQAHYIDQGFARLDPG